MESEIMDMSHPFVKSETYELIKTVEFDVSIGDDAFILRVELFRVASDHNYFRAHIWRREFFYIQSAFPQDDKTHEPIDPPSTENILVDYSYQLSGKYSHFQAESPAAALQVILDDFKRWLEHIQGG
jgi:hypothetical protein